MAHTPGPRNPDIQYIANLLAINDELLVACEMLLRQLKHCESLLDVVKYDATQVSPAEEQARTAIAKAKGETDDSHR